MNAYEAALLDSLVVTIRAAASACRAKGTLLHTARAEGLEAGAETLVDALRTLTDDAATLTTRIAAQLEAFEALMIWGSEMGRAVVPSHEDKGVSLAATPTATARGANFGEAALKLVTALGLSPGRTRDS